MPALQPITIDNIEGGAFKQRINEQLEAMSIDLIARGDLQKTWTLNISISVAPKMDPNTRANHPTISNTIKPVYPAHAGSEMRGVVKDNQIKINPGGDFDNPQQDFLPATKWTGGDVTIELKK